MGRKDTKSGDGATTTTVHKSSGKKGKKGSDSSSDDAPTCGEIAPDCFRMVSPVYLLIMFLVISLLGLCALDPEDCELIPGVGGFMREHAGWVGLLFYGILVLNSVLSAVAVKHCMNFHLTKKTTGKWLGQTLVAGYPSLKMLKEMEVHHKVKPAASTAGHAGTKKK